MPLKSAADLAAENTADIEPAESETRVISREGVIAEIQGKETPVIPREGVIAAPSNETPGAYVLPEPPLASSTPEEEYEYTDEELAELGGDAPSDEWMQQIAERREAERVQRCADNNLPPKVLTACVIYQAEGGQWGYSNDLDAFADDVFVERPVTDEDIWHGGEYLSSKANFMLLMTNIVQNTMANFDMRAQAAMQQQQANMEAAHIAQQTGLSSTGIPLNRQQRRAAQRGQ